MINRLKKKSDYSYLTIFLLIILSSLVYLWLVQGQHNSGETINVAGEQNMLVERIALLSHHYQEEQTPVLKKKLRLTLEKLKANQEYLRGLDNPIVNEILYSTGYQHNYIFEQYVKNVAKYIDKPTEKLLNIIDYTSESIVTIDNTLVALLADENDRKIALFTYILIVTTLFILLAIFLIYKKVTSVSILEAEKNLIELDKQTNFMTTVLENSAHAIIATDTHGIITLFNKKAEELLGYSREEVILKQTPELFHDKEEVIHKTELLNEELGTDITPGFQTFVEKSRRNMDNQDEWTYISKDGRRVTVKLSVTLLKNSQSAIIGYLGIAEDITAIKKDERIMKEYVHLIDQHIISSSTDIKGKIVSVSEAFCKISGYTKKELLGKDHKIVRHPDMPTEVYKDLWEHLLNDEEWTGELKNLKKDGGFYWVATDIFPNFDENGEKVGYTSIRQDITDKKLIEKLSITDGLTDIYNRRHFDNIFSKMLKSSKRSKEFISFLIMDVDHFKQYNDTYGHQMGDKVLIEIAKTLKKSLKREDDFCFRLGGEEFGVVFNTQSKDEALQYANKIKDDIEALKIEHLKNSASRYVTVSMGLICLNREQVEDEDVIYREADELLYQAKEQGRNRIIVKEAL